MKKPFCFVVLLALATSCSAPEPEVIDQRLTVYPNPASDQAYIRVRDPAAPHKITAFNSDGKISLQFEVGAGSSIEYPILLNLPHEGTYHVVLEMKGEKITKDILRLKR